MRKLLLLGLNHTTAPLEVREQLAFSANQRGPAVAALRRRMPETEIVLLSTCNRVEIYAAGQSAVMAGEISGFLATQRGLSPDHLTPHLYQKADRLAVEHLFLVASSLDSMVLGETQILGQVHKAYEASAAESATGPTLNPLFQKAIAAGKRVMAETALAEGRMSVASVAVEYARRIFDRFADKTVLCIGAAKMASLVLENLRALNPGRLLICNRDGEKAVLLASRFGGQAVPFDRLADHLAHADIVVSSTGAEHPIITRPMVESALKQRRYRPIFMIDIALPRDVEPAVADLENVYLYNLDDLQKAVAGTQSRRSGSLDAARQIIKAEVEAYALWERQREMGPMIERLYARYQTIAQEELQRTLSRLPGISAEEKSHLEDLTRRLVNKLLHDPIAMMRKGDGMHGPAAQYLHSIEKLFRLNDPAEPTDDESNPPL